MSASVPQIATALARVLTEVPAELAQATGFCRRRSKVTAAGFVQTLVLGWLAHPTGSLHRLTQAAAMLGLAVSPQGLVQRFTPAGAALLAGVLEAAVREVVVAAPVAAGLLARFPAVVLMDSTTVALPDGLAQVWAGCGGRVPQGSQAGLKLTVRLDLGTGRLAGPPFLPNGAFTMHPSAACHSQSRPTSPSYARSNTAQARSRAPLAAHSLNRAWTVDLGPKRLGSSFHWLPVRASQIRPSKIARSSRRGRPGFLRSFSTRSTGSRSAHRASSTSQIVGSLLAVRAVGAAGCGVSIAQGYHLPPLSG